MLLVISSWLPDRAADASPEPAAGPSSLDPAAGCCSNGVPTSAACLIQRLEIVAAAECPAPVLPWSCEMGDEESEVEDLERILSDANMEPIKIPYAVIKSITKNFAQVIGDGGFGVVYLGGLKNGMVAVKKISSKDLSDKQFFDEVSCLKKVKHKNIVRFLGYCADTQGEVVEVDGKLRIVEVLQRLLCFEYIPNGNLHHYLKEKGHGHGWNICYKIIRGICQGLCYLHRERITHLDLKPENVLLGAHMEPKITDFGLSRFIDEKQSIIFATNCFGALGYMAPEFIDKRQISLKSDIFSLGTIMTKLLTGSNDSIIENWHESLDVNCPQMQRCIEIAKVCVDRDPCNRPTIDKIILMLDEVDCVKQMMVPPVINEPSNDPRSSLYQVVQRFCALPAQILSEHSRMVDIYKELNVLEHILEGSERPSNLSYPLLQFITENFSVERRVGQNEFGEYFKGIVRIVDVTRLSGSLNINDGMFHRQVENMILARHQNIIRFIGYCSYAAEKDVHIDGKIVIAEKRERLLCFEYLRNGNLKKYLSDELRGFEWPTRYQIIKGICEGLCYLHTENDIIHMDLKPASILLDDRMVPKITDFGISELIIRSNKRLQRLGYSAPECMFAGTISRKADIYSLGVVITEVVTGTKEKPIITKVLRRWKHRWNKSAEHVPLWYQQVTKCLELAQSCLHKDPNKRPLIWDIIRVLNDFSLIRL
ncbi:unnamed protein product [Urochloa decumbens]|uniref:Protein kinase domain-containing protein n=1 Tax=Urochloa decumbens TaxID=240449 RepID=A0ABC9B447_9POAL